MPGVRRPTSSPRTPPGTRTAARRPDNGTRGGRSRGAVRPRRPRPVRLSPPLPRRGARRPRDGRPALGDGHRHDRPRRRRRGRDPATVRRCAGPRTARPRGGTPDPSPDRLRPGRGPGPGDPSPRVLCPRPLRPRLRLGRGAGRPRRSARSTRADGRGRRSGPPGSSAPYGWDRCSTPRSSTASRSRPPRPTGPRCSDSSSDSGTNRPRTFRSTTSRTRSPTNWGWPRHRRPGGSSRRCGRPGFPRVGPTRGTARSGPGAPGGRLPGGGPAPRVTFGQAQNARFFA